MDHCGIVVERCGSLRDRCGIVAGLLWIIVDCCGSLWVVVDRCGSLWVVVGHCGSLWVVVGHCGSLWVVVDRCGSLWVVPGFSNYDTVLAPNQLGSPPCWFRKGVGHLLVSPQASSEFEMCSLAKICLLCRLRLMWNTPVYKR